MQQLLPEREEAELSDLLRKKKNANGIHRINNEIVEYGFNSNIFYTVYVRRYST